MAEQILATTAVVDYKSHIDCVDKHLFQHLRKIGNSSL